MSDKDLSMTAPVVNTAPGPEYAAEARLWQGIPGIERAPNGRLWALWYTGGEGEGPYNYIVLETSDDDGETWSKPLLVIDPPDKVRAFDPCLWHDPTGKLWLFWAQSYELFDGRCGVWCITTENSGEAAPVWSEPRRIGNGIMMNKPTVLSSGEWLFPTAVWECKAPRLPEFADERFSNVLCTEDEGKTFTLRGGADVPKRSFDEHMVVELSDGRLWMLVRGQTGIGESYSEDKGFTWSPGVMERFSGPSSRFFIRRLSSGNLLLVNHVNFEERKGEEGYNGRNNMTALISDDDGATWKGGLLLDERYYVSYPDGVQAEDGRIYVIYDRERRGAKEILMAVFREEDILAGQCVSDDARLKVLVNKIPEKRE